MTMNGIVTMERGLEQREKEQAQTGPLIYNLFPLLLGPIERWSRQLGHIAGMGFDWIYLNPFHYSGFSGSLYAIKDPYRLHTLLESEEGADGLEAFIAEVQHHRLRIMADLVINHTAKDALLVTEHPDWFRREPSGALTSPQVAAAEDAAKITVWGDLAELDYEDAAARAGLIAYWLAYLRHYIALGVSGFRCDAAYKVPAPVWRELIAGARAVRPGILFFAETLGARLEEVTALKEAGFDYFFNSSKWWDFRSDWLLDQYESLRRTAPSIAFPESHDTERLATEIGTDDPDRVAQFAKFRYLFAACFSTGAMIPIGFEYGFRKRLDVVRTRPEDWEEPLIDISDFIAAANAMKRGIPLLNQEAPQRRVTAPDAPVVGLLREAPERNDGAVLLLMNPDAGQAHGIDPGPLLFESGGIYARFEDVTPQASPLALEPGRAIMLEPLELRVFKAERAEIAHDGMGRRVAGDPERLDRLASSRVTIEEVWPQIDGGRHPVKRAVGDMLEVWADIFADGHDRIAAVLRYREEGARDWAEAPMALVDNDRWVGRFPLARNGRYLYVIEAWRDLFASWRRDLVMKQQAGQAIALELVEGRRLVENAARVASERDARSLSALLDRLVAYGEDPAQQATMLLSEELQALMNRAGPRMDLSRYAPELEVVVDRTAARYGAWYELFPRSASGDPARHGTFEDVIARLPSIAAMGFDVLYLPPIHPIGHTNRKGRNNSLAAGPNDPGSVYAIGSEEGGHTAIHPALGDFASFDRLLRAARAEGIEIALDFAVQCSPDHPWLKQHPDWFDWRPDGSIRFAENPPKKYEDIVNFRFDRDNQAALWRALLDVVLFWVARGVRIFRVDNPHTKPVPFWEWLIREVQDRDPGIVFLAEAFTRPKMMRKLAKVGFSQSYSYFTWRHSKAELTDYFTELTQLAPKEYLRPNLFANTPDINPPFLQTGGRPAFQIRAVLAATLSSLWGIYNGFELCEAAGLPGREEYRDSEKYEIKAWDWDRPGNIRAFIARLNRIRRDNPALHELTNLRFHDSRDDNVIFYGKVSAARDNAIWIAVNLDPVAAHETIIQLPLEELGIEEGVEIEVEDLLEGTRFAWRGREQRVHLDPARNVCAIWRVKPRAARP
jgi:starch synthase (maltosyl-transferring)